MNPSRFSSDLAVESDGINNGRAVESYVGTNPATLHLASSDQWGKLGRFKAPNQKHSLG